MSAKAGTIQGTRNGGSRSSAWAAWTAAFLLTALIAVALFAVINSKGTSETAPTAVKVESTVPVGFSHVAPTTADPTTDTRPLVTSPNYVCHQCR